MQFQLPFRLHTCPTICLVLLCFTQSISVKARFRVICKSAVKPLSDLDAYTQANTSAKIEYSHRIQKRNKRKQETGENENNQTQHMKL